MRGEQNANATTGTNVWDVVRAALVLITLAVLTIYLVDHYGADETKAAAVLGIVAPILAAVVGVSIGYAAGNETGKSKGRKSLADHLRGVLDRPRAEGPADAAAQLRELRARLDSVASE